MFTTFDTLNLIETETRNLQVEFFNVFKFSGVIRDAVSYVFQGLNGMY